MLWIEKLPNEIVQLIVDNLRGETLDDLRNFCIAIRSPLTGVREAKRFVGEWTGNVRKLEGVWPDPVIGWNFPNGVMDPTWGRRLTDTKRCSMCLGDDHMLGKEFLPDEWMEYLPQWSKGLCRRCFIYRFGYRLSFYEKDYMWKHYKLTRRKFYGRELVLLHINDWYKGRQFLKYYIWKNDRELKKYRIPYFKPPEVDGEFTYTRRKKK